jgi:preprotein translocase subunit SecD
MQTELSDLKPWYQSTTIISAVAIVIQHLVALYLGIELADTDSLQIANIILTVTTTICSGIAIYGRVKAQKIIKSRRKKCIPCPKPR